MPVWYVDRTRTSSWGPHDGCASRPGRHSRTDAGEQSSGHRPSPVTAACPSSALGGAPGHMPMTGQTHRPKAWRTQGTRGSRGGERAGIGAGKCGVSLPQDSRGHFFTQVAPKLYLPSGLTSISYVVGLYSMSGGQVSLHVASSRNLWQTCVKTVRMGQSAMELPRGGCPTWLAAPRGSWPWASQCENQAKRPRAQPKAMPGPRDCLRRV